MIVVVILYVTLLSSVASADIETVKIHSYDQLTGVLHEALQSHTKEIHFDLYDSTENIEKKILDAADKVNYYGDYISQTRNMFYWSWLTFGPNLSKIEFRITYFETPEQTQYVDQVVNETISSIIKPGMDDFTKEKVIHDWIVNRLSYDYGLIEQSAFAGIVPPYKTVCQGYSLLANNMLSKAGIENKIVYGWNEGSAHSWNLVKLDGHWYHLDVTWNDNGNSYDYYNLTDDQISSTRTWFREYYPAAGTDFKVALKQKHRQGKNVLEFAAMGHLFRSLYKQSNND
ncbi:hypothetical protein HP548_12335 [Paenibacillus taichungensis]|uniref:Transglutaminase-like domain-containing protein n=1 Tax=Paenibacillus taichungensis TaxID=484184 RepID=A0ABX2MLI5_9BACL|nr:transglutaminase domain-containing protein [Paenibacillus taichungensis]NUU54865.1 hypothetical protein [Paenibacillus taichungensis]